MGYRTPAASSGARYDILDSARAVAILSVILVHSGSAAESMATRNGQSLIPEFVLQATDLGKFGVQLFFLLSGLLVANLYRPQNSENNWKMRFALKRFGRIVPLWVGFLLLQIALYVSPFKDWSSLQNLNTSGADQTSFIFLVALLALTFTLWIVPEYWNTVIAGGWSIQVEVAHYFLFMMLNGKSLVVWVRLLFVSQLLNLLAFVATLSEISNLKWVGDTLLRFGLGNSFFFFSLGVIVVRVLEINGGGHELQQIRDSLTWPIIGTLVLLAITPGNLADNLLKIGFVVLAMTASYFLSRSKALQRPLASIAKYSYFMYFCHFWVLAAIFRAYEQFGREIPLNSGSALVLLGLVYVFAIGASWFLGKVSFRVLERPSQEWILREGTKLSFRKIKL